MSDPTSQSLVSQQFSRWLQVRKVGTCSTTTATIIIYLFIYLFIIRRGRFQEVYLGPGLTNKNHWDYETGGTFWVGLHD